VLKASQLQKLDRQEAKANAKINSPGQPEKRTMATAASDNIWRDVLPQVNNLDSVTLDRPCRFANSSARPKRSVQVAAGRGRL